MIEEANILSPNPYCYQVQEKEDDTKDPPSIIDFYFHFTPALIQLVDNQHETFLPTFQTNSLLRNICPEARKHLSWIKRSFYCPPDMCLNKFV